MRTAVVLFTRDLRIRDNPALASAVASAETVVPLYVLDPKLRDLSPNRTRFLHQSLADQRETFRGRGVPRRSRRSRPRLTDRAATWTGALTRTRCSTGGTG